MRITNKFNIIAMLMICGCGAVSTDASETVGTDSAPLVNPIWTAFVLGSAPCNPSNANDDFSVMYKNQL